MKGKKDWDWFECFMCGKTTYNEDEMIYCDTCGNSFCDEHIVYIEHQGFDEAICNECKESKES